MAQVDRYKYMGYIPSMKKLTTEVAENASEMVRVYPSDYKRIIEEAKSRRTIAAQIVHEALAAKTNGNI